MLRIESMRKILSKPHCWCLCSLPSRTRYSKVVVWDSWSHVRGPVLDWPCALRWWMAADCSDSLGTWLVCCGPHNGLTHGELMPSLFCVYILLHLSVWLLCWFLVLMETEVFSCDSFPALTPQMGAVSRSYPLLLANASFLLLLSWKGLVASFIRIDVPTWRSNST